MFKHVKGKKGTTSFLPLDSKKGVNITHIRDAMCLTEDQTKYIYKKVEQGSDLKTETMKKVIEQEKMAEIKPSGENENLFQKVVLNNVYKDENKTAQMESWSILSDNVRYVQHDERSKTTCNLDMETLDYQVTQKAISKLEGRRKSHARCRFWQQSRNNEVKLFRYV